jgi:spore germination protein GerM
MTPIKDAISLLIKGELTEEERAQGFTTEFPNEDFKLLDVNLKDGVLYLEFTEVPGFTTGGSCRISLLTNQIIKTAKQFLGVNEVVLLPESIFQP